MIGLKEIERARFLARRVCELHAVLADERALLELLQQAHALKCEVSVSHQRFAYMVPRESLLFEQHDAAAFARQNAGHRTTRRPAANDDHIVVSFGFHLFYT